MAPISLILNLATYLLTLGGKLPIFKRKNRQISENVENPVRHDVEDDTDSLDTTVGSLSEEDTDSVDIILESLI